MAAPPRVMPRSGSWAVAAVAVAATVGGVHGRLTSLHAECQAWQRSAVLPCQKPVQRAAVSLPPGVLLGGATAGTSMFSGYVNVTDQDYLFYLFAEANARAPSDAPLIVWTGGGPGCSAMEAATMETGPYVLFDVKQGSSMFPRKFSKNAWTWNRFAHVLYVDQPRYVGFSTGTGAPVTSSADAGRDMVHFLLGWRRLFPEHSRRPLIFASDSYGGHLVAAWAAAVLDHNSYGLEPLMLRGIAVGNAILNETVQSNLALHEFARREKLIPENERPGATFADTRAEMMVQLGYSPNVYDYRLQDQECCGCTAYNYKAWADFLLMESISQSLHVCGGAGVNAFGGCGGGCIDLIGLGFDQNGRGPDTLANLGRVLQEGIPVTLFYGMQDIAANYVGGFAAASALHWSGAKEFAGAPLEDFHISGTSAGQVKSGGGLNWMQIKGAGHMVAADHPAAAIVAMSNLIKQVVGEDPPEMLRYT